MTAVSQPESSTENTDDRRPYLLARAGEVVCALPLGSVRQVVKALSVHRLPGSRDELAGLAEFVGEPLPVLDLARLVGAAPGANPAYPVTLVCWAGDGRRETVDSQELVGLAADAALEVVGLDPDAVVAVDGGVTAGEARVGDDVVRVLDLGALSREGSRGARPAAGSPDGDATATDSAPEEGAAEGGP